MKKRNRPPEQDRGEFNNNPFTFLKKFTPAPSQPKAPEAPATKPLADDHDLFQRAMSGTRRLDPEAAERAPEEAGSARARSEDEDQQAEFLRAMSGTRRLHPHPGQRIPPAQPDTRAETPAEDQDEEKSLFMSAVRKMGTTIRLPESEDETRDEVRRSSSGRMKQLRRGTIRISSELDLHGSLRDEALAKLRIFIAAAYSRGQKAVLVITGKGINSPEGPVLQGAVAGWLRSAGKGMVAEFGPAPLDKGGSGAYVVFLKNPASR